MDKKIIIIAVLFGVIVVLGYYIYINKTSVNNNEPVGGISVIDSRTEPEKTTDLKAENDAIKSVLFGKYNWKPSEMNFTVNTNDGKYASGGVVPVGGDVGGGYWFAAKVGDSWKIVADGNGTISCEQLAPYPGFPSKLISECIDTKTGNPIKR